MSHSEKTDLLEVLAQAEQSIIEMAQDSIEPEALNHPDYNLEADFPILTTIREAIAKGKANNQPKPLHTALKAMHQAYGKLHDGLSDMIEEGRLTEADIPDDYQWLVETLSGPCLAANATAETQLEGHDAS